MRAVFHSAIILAFSACLIASPLSAQDIEGLSDDAAGTGIKDLGYVLKEQKKNFEFFYQGDCGERLTGEEVSRNKATLTCIGKATADKMIIADYGVYNGPQFVSMNKNCFAVTNRETKSYLIPLKTEYEWLNFKASAEDKKKPLGDVEIVYGCPGGEEVEICGEKKTLPNGLKGGDPAIISYNQNRYDIYECRVPGQATCGTWTKVGQKGECIVDVSLEPHNCARREMHADVSVVLDASMSMKEELCAAKQTLSKLVRNKIKDWHDVRLSLHSVGGDNHNNMGDSRPNVKCSNKLGTDPDSPSGWNPDWNEGQRNFGRVLPMRKWDDATVEQKIAQIGRAPLTPIGKAMAYAGEDFTSPSRQRFMILLSDGYDTCKYGYDGSPQHFHITNNVITDLLNKDITLLGVHYINGPADTAGGVTFRRFGDGHVSVIDVSDAANLNNNLFLSLQGMFSEILGERCTIQAWLYQGGRLITPEPIIAANSAQVKPGIYDVKYQLCHSQVRFVTGVEIRQDTKLDTMTLSPRLTCPRADNCFIATGYPGGVHHFCVEKRDGDGVEVMSCKGVYNGHTPNYYAAKFGVPGSHIVPRYQGFNPASCRARSAGEEAAALSSPAGLAPYAADAGESCTNDSASSLNADQFYSQELIQFDNSGFGAGDLE